MQPIMAQRIVNWQQGIQSPPYELMICPTHRCNLRCAICARSWEGDTAGVLFDELPDERWLRLLDEAAAMGVRYLNIGGGGEPTLRRDLIMDLCSKAKAGGMEVHLQTNGTTLSKEDWEKLLNIGLDYITVSVDGPTAAINDAIRFEKAFDKTVTRLGWLHQLKKERRSPLPKLQINMVLTALNYKHLDDMVHFCVEQGVEYLSVKTLLEYSPDMKDFILSDAQKLGVPEEIEKALALASKLGLATNLDTLITKKSEQNQVAKPKPRESQDAALINAKCLEPWRGIVVSSSGHVAPCCFFWDGAADSIRDKSLQEVWLGPYLRNFRQQMQQGDLPPFCISCRFPESNDHCQLRACVVQAVETRGHGNSNVIALIRKTWINLRRSGVRRTWKRFQEWRAIRRAFRKEAR